MLFAENAVIQVFIELYTLKKENNDQN